MKRLSGLLMVAGLVLMMNIAPGWGGPPNPTASDGNRNTAGGTKALQNVVGFDNTAFGDNALQNNDTGNNNTASGADALASNTAGNFNTASGADALQNNTTGESNTASGASALASNTTGNFNTASGADALAFNTSGRANTASGVFALQNNTTGESNTASGVSALGDNTTGTKNTALGVDALGHSTGSQNIAVGHMAGVALLSGNKNIYIGNPGVSSETRTMRLGSAQTHTFIAGVATTGVNGGAVVEIDASGQLGVTLSSARYKRDIAAMGTRSEGVFRLRPVTFSYRDDAQGVTHFGLVAEEVAAVYPDLVTRTAGTGEPQTVRYQELIPMLLNELQRQHQGIERQARELAELREMVGRLTGPAAAQR